MILGLIDAVCWHGCLLQSQGIQKIHCSSYPNNSMLKTRFFLFTFWNGPRAKLFYIFDHFCIGQNDTWNLHGWFLYAHKNFFWHFWAFLYWSKRYLKHMLTVFVCAQKNLAFLSIFVLVKTISEIYVDDFCMRINFFWYFEHFCIG